MKSKRNLTGWNLIIYQLIKSKFYNNKFKLEDIYRYEEEFKKVYPENFHIKDKIRQTLQNLRNYGFLNFLGDGEYQLTTDDYILDNSLHKSTNYERVYLLSNESMPEWIKIGRTGNLDERIKSLYNTSVPLPFKLEDSIEVNTLNDSQTLEKSIHSIIDTINPSLRQNTEAKKREFFKMIVEEAKKVFVLVRVINTVEIKNQESLR